MFRREGNGGRRAFLGEIEQIFGKGTATGLTESELLGRFVNQGDEAAFTALVIRHGPMVLGVCRRLLRDIHDVEDAFQATFLVLARRASAIKQTNLIAPWLHGVAHRVSVRARAKGASRSVRELALEGAPELESAGQGSPVDKLVASELRGLLDDELARLPEALRKPLILCYLEGLTHDEAALELRWPVGTVRSRMARGRTLLRNRLAKQGHSSSGMAIVGGLTREIVPRTLLDATINASLGFTTGKIPASAAALALAKGTIGLMALQKAAFVSMVVVAGTISVAGAAAFGYQFGGQGAGPGAGQALVAQPLGEPGKVDGNSDTDTDTANNDAKPDDLAAYSRAVTAALNDAKYKFDLLQDHIKNLNETMDKVQAQAAGLMKLDNPEEGKDEIKRLRSDVISLRMLLDQFQRQAAQVVALGEAPNPASTEPKESPKAAAPPNQPGFSVGATPNGRPRGKIGTSGNAVSGGEGSMSMMGGMAGRGGGMGMGGMQGGMAMGGMQGAMGGGMPGGMGGGGMMGGGMPGGMGGQGAMMGGGMPGVSSRGMGMGTGRRVGGIAQSNAGRVVFVRDNSVICTVVPEGNRVTAYDTVNSTSSVVEFGKEVRAVPLAMGTMTAIGFVSTDEQPTSPPTVKKLAVYQGIDPDNPLEKQKPGWKTRELNLPFEGFVKPQNLNTGVLFELGNDIHIYSRATQQWSHLVLPKGDHSGPTIDDPFVFYEAQGHLHVFNTAAGNWIDINSRGDKPEPAKDEPAKDEPAKPDTRTP